VEVTVESSPVEDGERHETRGDADITVSATAANGTTLEEVLLRINGEHRETRSLVGTNATEAFNATRFTVFKDSEAAHVFLESPYETVPWHDIGDGTQAGPVVVPGGGLLSVFSFVPLRLVGLGLDVLVGLAVVLTLVRFVLRRVGDSGEETGG
jgi:hypothetical protein